MEYLTEEELFELQHQDEMDAMDDIDIQSENDILNFMSGGKTSKTVYSSNEKYSDCNVSNINMGEILSESTAHNNLRTFTMCSNTLKHIESPVRSNDTCGITPRKPEKENTPTLLSSKRKLSFCDDPPSSDYSKIAVSGNVEDDFEGSESLRSKKPKLTISAVSDLEESSASHSAKKSRLSLNETVEMFLQGITSSRARSSFFEEVRTFSKDQQMVTCTDGYRKYYNVKEEDDPQDLIPSFSQRTSCLLSTPIDVLKSQYFIMNENEKLQKQTEESSDKPAFDDVTIIKKDAESSLWVEKYRPLSYMNLLSEEGINRTLLQWLKLWDKVVFGREKKAKKKKDPKNPNFPNPKFQKQGELIEELDEHGRPYHKVAFLCGPPGLGKTTLAVIIAKHAGYNVVEINASDDRSPEVFHTSLEAATQMKAVLNDDHRPNCLILDEIDGAPAPSINVLLSFVKSTGYVKGKRKKGDIPLLMRPIICICNDQYSPALKSLRQISLLLNFPPTTTSRLASRLNEISSKEGLVADMNALNLLCEKSSNDIRSCLSTLQFFHQTKKALKISDLEGMTIGQKDMQKSLFAVWQEVFHFTDNPSFDKILSSIQSFGDYDKVYIGIFENYVNIKYKYSSAIHVWSGADWLCFGDIIQQQIAHYQLYFLLSYLPYPAVAFHMMFSSSQRPHISYPSAFYENKSRMTQLSNTLTSMIKDMVSSLKTFLNPSVLLLDIFPFLLEIIKPNLRPVNTQLYSEREKNELKRVIDLMLDFHLNYRQERQQDGTYSYVLDPNIEELTKFTGVKSNKALTYSTKQMIAREVEMEQMRKGDAASDVVSKKFQNQTKVKSTLTMEPVKKTIVEKPTLDFFGRVVTGSKKTKQKAKGDPRDEDVWFHFKEGYSNAVRRPIYIKDLL